MFTNVSKNFLIYPTNCMNITQNYKGASSHLTHSSGKPADYPIDEACSDTGRSYFYCPCDKMKVTRLYTKGTNTIWLESVEKVVLANGKSDYVTILITHPNDDDFKNLYINKIFKRGEKICREGTDGNATGNHFHISVGKGKMKDIGWVQNSKKAWVISTKSGAVKPEEAFYIDNAMTVLIKKSNGLQFKVLPLKPISAIAKEVISGKYGNGSARKLALEKEGYVYSDVQAEVNKILKGAK